MVKSDISILKQCYLIHIDILGGSRLLERIEEKAKNPESIKFNFFKSHKYPLIKLASGTQINRK